MNVTLIKDIETRDVISLPPEAALGEALTVMDERKISLLVMVKDDKPVGVLTERDVVRLAARHEVTDQTLLRTVMTSPVHTVHENADIFEAYDLLTTRQIRHLVVTDAEGSVTGLLTQSDLLGNLGIEYFIDLKHVSSIMTRALFTLTGNDPVQKALEMMERERISCVIVVEDGRPAGIWTERDVTHFCHARMNARTTRMQEVMVTPVRTTKGLEGRYVSFLKRMLKTRNETIRHGREQQEALFDLNPNVSFSLDIQGVIQDCNMAGTLLTGYAPEAMAGKSMAQFIEPGDVSGFEQALCMARKNNPAHCECYIDSATGESIAIFLSLITVSTMGQVSQIYGVAHDITEHRRAEKALRVKLDEI